MNPTYTLRSKTNINPTVYTAIQKLTDAELEKSEDEIVQQVKKNMGRLTRFKTQIFESNRDKIYSKSQAVRQARESMRVPKAVIPGLDSSPAESVSCTS